MKIKNSEAIGILNAFSTLGDKVLPRKLSYAVTKNQEALISQIYTPYQKELEKIGQTYAKKDADGNPVKNEKGERLISNPEAYKQELEELLETENEYEPHWIEEEWLNQCESEARYSDPTVREYAALQFFVKE